MQLIACSAQKAGHVFDLMCSVLSLLAILWSFNSNIFTTFYFSSYSDSEATYNVVERNELPSLQLWTVQRLTCNTFYLTSPLSLPLN